MTPVLNFIFLGCFTVSLPSLLNHCIHFPIPTLSSPNVVMNCSLLVGLPSPPPQLQTSLPDTGTVLLAVYQTCNPLFHLPLILSIGWINLTCNFLSIFSQNETNIFTELLCYINISVGKLCFPLRTVNQVRFLFID